MPIALSCPCGAKLSVPDSMAGKEGACPTCRAPLAVPAPPAAFDMASADLTESRDLAVSDLDVSDRDEGEGESGTPSPAPAASRPAPAPSVAARPARTPTMRFRCPKCRKTLRVALRFAGQQGKCGGCGASFTAPVPENVPLARAVHPGPARPATPPPSLRAAFAFERVKCACGVTFARSRADGECPACGRLLPADASG